VPGGDEPFPVPPRSTDLLNALLSYARHALGADHVLLSEWAADGDTLTTLGVSGELTDDMVTTVGLLVHNSDYIVGGSESNTRRAFRTRQPAVLRRDDSALTPQLHAYLDRIGAATEVIVPVRESERGGWLMEVYFRTPSRLEPEQLDDAMRFGALAGAVVSRDEVAAALERSDALYRGLVEQLPAHVFQRRPDGKLMLVGPWLARWLGYDPESWVVGDDSRWTEALHEDDADRVVKEYAAALAAGEPYADEYRMRRIDGAVVWLREVDVPIRDSHGEVVSRQGVVFDVTDLLTTRSELARRARQHEVVSKLGLGALQGEEWHTTAVEAVREVADVLEAELTVALDLTPEGLTLVPGAVVGTPERLVALDLSPESDLMSAFTNDDAVVLDGESPGAMSGVMAKIAALGINFGVLLACTDDARAISRDDANFVQSTANVLAAAAARGRVASQLSHSEQQRREVFAQLLRAADEERRRVAMELHDDTIQVMTAALISLDRQRNAEEIGDTRRAAEAAIAVRESLAAAVERTRRLSFELVPPLLEVNGLEAAVSDLLAVVAADAGFAFEVSAGVARHSFAVEALAYRTIQELLSNVRRHAHAANVQVRLADTDGVMEGEVADDGVGFDPSALGDRRAAVLHFGLDAAAERVRLAGGAFRFDSRLGGGTRVWFTIPLEPVPAAVPSV
jgi:PAS domain S-box-containing protein